MAFAALKDDNQRFTYADCLSWDENERIEIIYGKPYMLPSPSRVHQEISGEIFRQIANFLTDKKCRVYHAPFGVRLFEKKGDSPNKVDTLVEPDISAICDQDKLDSHGCIGAPDLVIEILSPSNFRHDCITKLNLYQKAGVREYWIVDPEEKTVTVMSLKDGHLWPAAHYERNDAAQVIVLDGCVIQLDTVFAE